MIKKRNKKIMLVLMVAILLLNTNATKMDKHEEFLFQPNVNSSISNIRDVILSLSEHETIEISSDSDFSAFPGSGTEADPYIIEGYNITTDADYGIYIHDTTKYFIVRNCYIDAKNTGVYISNVADNTAKIINNTLTNNNMYGIYLVDSDYANITNNTITNNGYGIFLSMMEYT
ncbi:MAG: NosD domain-containing protein [Candidatus Heimdallarchaeaceae archaeon]